MQFNFIQNNTEIEVTGNLFIHSILTEVSEQNINSEASVCSRIKLRRKHVPESITHNGKRQKNQRQQRPPEDKGKKAKCSNKLYEEKDLKKPELCEFAIYCRYQRRLLSNSPEKTPLNGLDFHDAM